MDSRSGYSNLESGKSRPWYVGSVGTVICGNYGFWIQEKQVPFPDGEEGSLGYINKSLVYFVVMICHLIGISHEDCGCLARSVEGVDQPPVQVVKRLL